MTPEEELKQIIVQLLEQPCTDSLPAICRMSETPEGKETVANMILQYCINNGCSVQTAMAFIDSEL